MKYKQVLKKDIKELSSVYLIYGEDEYLINNFVDEFTNKFLPSEYKDFNLNVLKEGEELISKIINATKTLPFMADRRIVLVESYELFTKKNKNIDLIYNLLDDFPETTLLLFISYKKPDKRLKLFKKIKEVGQIVQFDSLRYKKLDNWIVKKAGEFGYEIKAEAVKLLEKAFNNNLQQLENELNKIVTFIGQKKVITREDVEKIISSDWLVKDNVIFDFVDAIGKKNVSTALKLLTDIIQDGSEPKQILGMIARQIRLMLQSKLLFQQGFTAKQIAKKLNQHPYPIKKCLKQSNNYSIQSLELALERLFETDYKLVTGADQKLELELLVIDLKETI